MESTGIHGGVSGPRKYEFWCVGVAQSHHRVTNRYVGNDILDFFVQSSAEFDDNRKSLGVSGLFNQFSEFVDILIYRTPSLVVLLCFQFGYGKSSFIFQTEFGNEGISEFFPGSEFRQSISDLVMDDALGEECGPAALHV
jgi:hypothetical protein